eukprot:m.14898 g.14898  ORF g.14898 m.14898 type:complete len:712 (+) comp8481_c0_seq1:115-2250(+)
MLWRHWRAMRGWVVVVTVVLAGVGLSDTGAAGLDQPLVRGSILQGGRASLDRDGWDGVGLGVKLGAERRQLQLRGNDNKVKGTPLAVDRSRRDQAVSIALDGRVISISAISLWWQLANASAANLTSGGYTVQCNGQLSGSTTSQWLAVTGLLSGTPHTCTVTAHLQNLSVTSAPQTVATMGTPSLPPIASNLTYTATDSTIELRWDIDVPGSVATGLMQFAVRRNTLVAATLPFLRSTITGSVAVTLRQLQPNTTYTITVAAQNAYGSAPTPSVVITTAAVDCAAVTCDDPPTCGIGEVATPFRYGNATCCPLYLCQPTLCAAGCSGSSTCVGGTCVPTPTCPANCSVCQPTSAACGTCGGGLFLLGALCESVCPPMGYAEVRPGNNGTGGWCQPVSPCVFLAANGTQLTLPHNARWCDGATRACRCELGVSRCVTRACQAAGPTESPTTAPSHAPSDAPAPSTPSPTGQTTVTTSPMSGTTGPLSEPPTAAPGGVPTVAMVDGGWSQWSAWSTCTLFGAMQRTQRTRTCSTPFPAGGGAECVGSSSQNSLCDPTSGWTSQPTSTTPTQAPTLSAAPSTTSPISLSTTLTATTNAGPADLALGATSGSSDKDASTAVGIVVAIVCIGFLIFLAIYVRRRRGVAALPPARPITITNPVMVTTRAPSPDSREPSRSSATATSDHVPRGRIRRMSSAGDSRSSIGRADIAEVEC